MQLIRIGYNHDTGRKFGNMIVKSVHFKKPFAQSSFLAKSVVIFAEIKTKASKNDNTFCKK